MASTVANRPRVHLPTSPCHRLSQSSPSNCFYETPAFQSTIAPSAEDAYNRSRAAYTSSSASSAASAAPAASAASPCSGSASSSTTAGGTPSKFAQIDRRLMMWNRATAGAGGDGGAGAARSPAAQPAAAQRTAAEAAVARQELLQRSGCPIPPVRSNSSPTIRLANSANDAAAASTRSSPLAGPAASASDSSSDTSVASQDRDATASGASSPVFPANVATFDLFPASPSLSRSRSAHVNGSAAVPGSPSSSRTQSRRSLGESSAFSFGRPLSGSPGSGAKGGSASATGSASTAPAGTESVFEWAAKRRMANRIKVTRK